MPYTPPPESPNYSQVTKAEEDAAKLEKQRRKEEEAKRKADIDTENRRKATEKHQRK